MKKILELKQTRSGVIAKMQEMNNTALAENRDFTADELIHYDALNAQQDALKSQISRLETQSALNDEMEKPASKPIHSFNHIKNSGDNQVLDEGGFSSFGEFLGAVRAGSDQRLQFVSQNMGSGDSGGYLVPQQFGEMITAFKPGEAIVRPRATVIPSGNMPDSDISFPALDQSGANGVYGGVVTNWVSEDEEIDETSFKLREIKLGSNGVAAYIPFSNKLLRNAPAAGALGTMLLRQALAKAEDSAFISGNGIGKPKGFMGSSATIGVNRATANKITYADLVKMVASSNGDMLEWFISKRAFTEIASLKDDSGRLIWQPGAVVGSPSTLLNLPVTWTTRTPGLGSKGDVILADLSYYYIKNGTGIIISMSEHVQFTKDKTLIKAVMGVDGQPAINGPLKDEDNNEYSPFVVLDIPAV